MEKIFEIRLEVINALINGQTILHKYVSSIFYIYFAPNILLWPKNPKGFYFQNYSIFVRV